MTERESHCPFLNRADYRCANHFSLDKLDRAFDHCFGEYQTCPTYREMLMERQNRQPADEHLVGSNLGGNLVRAATGLTSTVVYANLTVRTRAAHVTVNSVRLPVKHASAA